MLGHSGVHLKCLVMGSIPGFSMAPKKLFSSFFGFLELGSVWLKVGPEFDSDCRQGYFSFIFQFGGLLECPWIKST